MGYDTGAIEVCQVDRIKLDRTVSQLFVSQSGSALDDPFRVGSTWVTVIEEEAVCDNSSGKLGVGINARVVVEG